MLPDGRITYCCWLLFLTYETVGLLEFNRICGFIEQLAIFLNVVAFLILFFQFLQKTFQKLADSKLVLSFHLRKKNHGLISSNYGNCQIERAKQLLFSVKTHNFVP